MVHMSQELLHKQTPCAKAGGTGPSLFRYEKKRGSEPASSLLPTTRQVNSIFMLVKYKNQ